jgi:hypothetical protein
MDIDALIYELLQEAIGWDIVKPYHAEAAEYPEYDEEAMEELRDIVRYHIGSEW